MEATASVNRVSMRLPPFWPEKPALWFAQLEAQFALNGISQDTTQYYHVLAQLDSKYAAEVEDIIITPPTTNKYCTLKSELISRLSATQSSRMRQLLEREELGDRTPSQFLRHLRAFSETALPDELLRTLWLGRLPLRMQDILAASPTTELGALAKLADKICDNSTGLRVSAVATETDDRIKELTQQIESLTASVAALSDDRFQARRPRSRSRNRSPTPAGKTIDKQFCWYHATFGNLARHCVPPCKYQTENSRGGQ